MGSRERTISGMTLLELMLAIAISAAIILTGLRMYTGYKKDADFRALQYNVDLLFQAAQNYYAAQCSRQWNPPTYNTTPPNPLPGGPILPDATPPTLDPGPPPNPNPTNWVGATTNTPIRINLADITPFLTRPLVMNPLVDNSSADAYVVQFNPIVQSRKINISIPGNPPTIDPTPATIGTIVIWQIQISAKINSPSTEKANLYRRYLAAECISNLNSSIVTPCSSATGNAYVVWQRLPSYASPKSTSDYWLSNPLLIQFKQMYTTYPINSLTKSGTGTSKADLQYYLCGG